MHVSLYHGIHDFSALYHCVNSIIALYCCIIALYHCITVSLHCITVPLCSAVQHAGGRQGAMPQCGYVRIVRIEQGAEKITKPTEEWTPADSQTIVEETIELSHVCVRC